MVGDTAGSAKEGPKYFVDIEGVDYPWGKDSITTAEIRNLGHLPLDVPVLMIDENNVETTLAEDATVPLKPGIGFSKKIKFRRG